MADPGKDVVRELLSITDSFRAGKLTRSEAQSLRAKLLGEPISWLYPNVLERRGLVHACMGHTTACTAELYPEDFDKLTPVAEGPPVTCRRCLTHLNSDEVRKLMENIDDRAANPKKRAAIDEARMAKQAQQDEISEKWGKIVVGAIGVALAIWLVASWFSDAGGAGGRRDFDCRDFSTQRAAQDYYNGQRGDPDNLDADNDGIACERNP